MNPTVLRITTRNARLQEWQALLANRRKRQRSGEFIVQGVRVVAGNEAGGLSEVRGGSTAKATITLGAQP